MLQSYNIEKDLDVFESDEDRIDKRESLVLVEKYIQKNRSMMEREYKQELYYPIV